MVRVYIKKYHLQTKCKTFIQPQKYIKEIEPLPQTPTI